MDTYLLPLQTLDAHLSVDPADPNGPGSWLSASDLHTFLRLGLVRRDHGLCPTHDFEAETLHILLTTAYRVSGGRVRQQAGGPSYHAATLAGVIRRIV